MSKRERDRLAVALAGREDVLGSYAPYLSWEKQSFKRYTARGLGGAVLEVVRSGTKTALNETWHPVVFGNRFASSKSFERWSEAAVAAERLAVEYVNRVLHALSGMPIAQRFARLRR